MIPTKLVMVKKTGKRYLYNGERRDTVVCKGEIIRVQGLSATHGPDKKFKRDTVNVLEVDLTEQLLSELYEQSDIKEPPPEPKVEIVLEPDRKPWVAWERWDGKRVARLTPYADEQLKAEGYDAGLDMLAGGMDENMLGDAAMDCAAYHFELTREKVREGYGVPCREAAADMIYEGMLKALAERRKGSVDP